jgi:peptidoglycan/LPS O-acetylase OafA/YrhL
MDERAGRSGGGQREWEVPGGQGRRPALPALTGLRFLAALAVVLLHFMAMIDFPPPLAELARQGGLGVSLFFVLSGFILVYHYAGWFEAGLGGYGAFIWRRFARVYPLHLLALILVTPLGLAAAADLPAGTVVLSWLANLALVQALVPVPIDAPLHSLWNGPSWSLSAEACFYLLFPLFAYGVLRRVRDGRGALRLLILLFALEVIVFVAALAALALWVEVDHTLRREPALPTVIFLSPLARVWEFFIGGATGLLFLYWRERLGRARGQAAAQGVLLLLLAAIVAGLNRAPGLWEVTGTWAHLVATLPFAALILLLATGRGWLARCLAAPPLVRLGEASYALYIIHFLPVLALRLAFPPGTRPPQWLAWLVMSGTILASLALYRWVERPAQRWLRGWADRRAAGRRLPARPEPSSIDA